MLEIMNKCLTGKKQDIAITIFSLTIILKIKHFEIMTFASLNIYFCLLFFAAKLRGMYI